MTHTSAARAVEVLADGTRRALVERLAAGPLSVSELADGLPVTRSAVSQHLSVLHGAGLVSHQRHGRRHVYRVDPAGLAALRAWVDALWDTALAGYAAAAERHDTETEDQP